MEARHIETKATDNFAPMIFSVRPVDRKHLWTSPDTWRYKRVRELVGPSKGEAKTLLAAKRAERLRGRQGISRKIDAPPFDQFVEGPYTEYARINKRGFHNEQYRLHQLTEFFGKRKLSELAPWHAENFKNETARRVAPATVNRLLGNLKHILSMAVKWESLSSNPFTGVKLLHVPKRVARMLTAEEEVKLLTACGQIRTPHLASIVGIALNTGMRKGEIHGLRWEHINLTDTLITIINGKTAESNRDIPMNEATLKLLSDLCEKRKSEFVFPSTRKIGERLLDPKVGFMKAVRLAGIPHIRFHDLRHTYATRLVRAGVDLVTIQHLLGHTNVTMTSRYTHSDADAKMHAVKRLDFIGVR
jgi:integrase